MLIQQLSQLSEKENRVQTARLLISGGKLTGKWCHKMMKPVIKN